MYALQCNAHVLKYIHTNAIAIRIWKRIVEFTVNMILHYWIIMFSDSLRTVDNVVNSAKKNFDWIPIICYCRLSYAINRSIFNAPSNNSDNVVHIWSSNDFSESIFSSFLNPFSLQQQLKNQIYKPQQQQISISYANCSICHPFRLQITWSI